MSDESQSGRDARAGDARIDARAVVMAVLVRAPRILLLTVLAMAVAYVVLLYTPRLYESSAEILVEPRTNSYIRPTNEPAPTLLGGEAGVVSSQIELIKSRDTLLGVIDVAGLRSVPEFTSGGGGFSPSAIIRRLLGRNNDVSAGDQIILANLFDRMTVAQQRDSRVITISVRTQDPDLSAKIANAVANAHVTRRAELYLSDTAEVSGWLNDEIEELRVSVEKAERGVANFRVENDLFTGSNNTSLLDQQLSTIAGQINAAQERKNQALSRATLIRGLIEQGQSIEGVPAVQQSTVVQQLTQELARLQGERAQLSATLLPNHPNVRAIDAQIGALEAQLREEGLQIADSLEAEAQIEADLEASMRGELEALKVDASAAARNTVTLQGLIREAEAQRDLLESYLRRYSEAASRTDANSALPDVRVISVAAASVSPVSPQTTMIMLAVGIVMMAGQVGIVIFAELISGRAIVVDQRIQRPQPVDADRIFEDEPAFGPESGEDGQSEVGQMAPAFMHEIPVDSDETDLLETDQAPDVHEPVMFEVEADRFSDEEPIVDLEQMAADDIPEPASTTPVRVPDHHKLSSDLALGRCRVVLFAGYRDADDCEVLAETLIDECLARGVSVALIDAGSEQSGSEFGISDLTLGEASFGDVVHKSADDGFAEVPWGQSAEFDRSSAKPATLIEALSDIYEVVLVLTGKADMASTLPAFAGVADRLVLVSSDDGDHGDLEAVREELAQAGYGAVEIVRPPVAVAA
jgi:succinoglycan biosynthesis transport protein ExoP